MDPPPPSKPNRPPESASRMASPTSSTAQHRGMYERDDALSESLKSTDTMRRRPTEGYGTIQPTTPGPSTHGGESSQAIRSPMLGPERGRTKPRKPPMNRRTSSNAMTPHRGEFFSVDDDAVEVEADVQALAAKVAQRLPPGFTLDPTKMGASVRRRAAAPPNLPRVTSTPPAEEEEVAPPTATGTLPKPSFDEHRSIAGDGAEEPHSPDPEQETPEEEDGDDDLSDAESFTLKDRQQAINETHPFGIRIWKAALYKKDRSVQKNAELDIHSSPGLRVSHWLFFFNITWTIFFGWWMSLFAAVGAIACFLFAAAPSGREYGRVLWGLAGYLFYPFGKFVRLESDETYAEEDEGEGRSITEYEQWQSGDLEHGRLFFGPERGRSIVGRSRASFDSEPDEADSLLGRGRNPAGDEDDEAEQEGPRQKRRLFGRGQWNIGRVIFFVVFYALLTPSLFIVSGICWFLVFWIPMAKVTILLLDHLRRHPLALSFKHDIAHAREGPHSSILLCTYRATGLKYWKYTVDGTNIFLINLMGVVFFVVADWAILDRILGMQLFLTSPVFLFTAGLFSVIPLAYFIGQAVASISAQSTMGVGAAINAFFSTVVEVFLYCVALNDGKAQLVEGSIIGSIFAGILFLPGLSMCFGAIKRKTQRFNAKSAGVTSTMLLFAVVGAFGPTLFYQIYGTHELNCLDCITDGDANGSGRDCRRCFFSQEPNLNDRFYVEAVRPYCYFAAMLLFLSYIIGLWFTLRTHAAVIWNSEIDEKKHEEQLQQQQREAQSRQAAAASLSAETSGADIRNSHLYKRILRQSLGQVQLESQVRQKQQQPAQTPSANGGLQTPHLVPPRNTSFPGLSEAENESLFQGMAEIAATAAAIAARDVNVRGPRGAASSQHGGNAPAQGSGSITKQAPPRAGTFPDPTEPLDAGHGGHDAPNWSRRKSAVILLGATILYAIIAEILVDTVDVVLEGFAIDEKFLGITLFALVPNTTEFLNAISFAMNGNIALSMEIGSAYALQVCLLQIPALVLYSAITTVKDLPPTADLAHYTFSLLFPQWDMVTVILCVFLLSYMYGEGKSNYFKGSILLLCYLVVMIGFYFSGMTNNGGMISMGMSRFDTFDRAEGEWKTFKTIGRSNSGMAIEV
ncbi:Sodium/calcium exchanger protein-domain-containing protein [Zalerion maritima]|uniref:Sodium/calcium exchanger protein-domain-containing protein n=1 Tax=Zalerion maritima TaxID=339359 RepID=A0AAD5RYP3_9PEZI|nr:Sodium/calcium exchanger protein-domain-containing protein [Zalerion maritima]